MLAPTMNGSSFGPSALDPKQQTNGGAIKRGAPRQRCGGRGRWHGGQRC